PLGLDDAVALQPAQEAVEVADVDAFAAELGQQLDQLVAVPRPLPEEQQQRRLVEALDARTDGPFVGADLPSAAVAAPVMSPVHVRNICQIHIDVKNCGFPAK